MNLLIYWDWQIPCKQCRRSCDTSLYLNVGGLREGVMCARVSVSHTVSFFSTNLLFPIGFSYTFIASFYLLTSAALLSQSNQLIVPLVKLSTYGPRSFAVAGPTIWNNLPEYPELSIDNFRRQLKTFLFAQYCRRHCSALETSCLCTL